ncbi:hypothetical protein CEXT_138771 [Caerostris extrusa]|uniref:Uncharacterized protein n=1 Tax=Caerostris extrusa TaxID=172846 RepID=A0AAV4R9M8_CAEEX|nr:hypothetical protein CEXT_138771 [Caerostris extrusa]
MFCLESQHLIAAQSPKIPKQSCSIRTNLDGYRSRELFCFFENSRGNSKRFDDLRCKFCIQAPPPPSSTKRKIFPNTLA